MAGIASYYKKKFRKIFLTDSMRKTLQHASPVDNLLFELKQNLQHTCS
jgi:hypothetical protein